MTTSISALDTEITELADDDLFVADDVSEVETAKVTVATLRAALGGQWPVTPVSGSSATLPARSQIVHCTGSGTVTLTLPPPANGRWIVIKAAPDTLIELVPHDGTTAIENGDPGDTYVLGNGANVWALFSDGSHWFRADHETVVAPTTSAGVWTIEELITPPSAAADTAKVYALQAVGSGGRTEPIVRLSDGTDVPLTRVPTRKTAVNLDINDRDETIFVTGGTVALRLPDPLSNEGRQGLIVKAHDGPNQITLKVFGAEKINGVVGDLILPGSGDAKRGRWHYICDGTDWEVT